MINIAGREIGLRSKPFIIAEMSGNHNQSLDRALAIVDAAANSGAHAIKIQTYTPDTMTIDLDSDDFKITDKKSKWFGRTLFDLYREATTPWEWHEQIFDRARNLGMIPFSTPFDNSAVDFLEGLGVPCYKIASFENSDIPLLRRVAMTGKPIIISTGMATLSELDEAVRTVRECGCEQLILLKCTSTYPASPENTNLQTIPSIRSLYDCEVGLSDHTMGIGVAIASVALGATVIEKHFTTKRSDGGIDSHFSIEPEEMRQLVIETGRARDALGKIIYGPTKEEEISVKYRRSLYLIKDKEQGEIIKKDDIKAIRPGYGLQTKFEDYIIGRRINRSVKKGTPISWDILS